MNYILLSGYLPPVYTLQSVDPSSLGSLERVVSYVGLLAIGWFFWKRDSDRSDTSDANLRLEVDALKKEVKKLHAENKELHEEIRTILKNLPPKS
jgi:hypothetical protein